MKNQLAGTSKTARNRYFDSNRFFQIYPLSEKTALAYKANHRLLEFVKQNLSGGEQTQTKQTQMKHART